MVAPNPVAVSLPPINQPLVSPGNWIVDGGWYRFFEDIRRRTGGDSDSVAGAIEVSEAYTDVQVAAANTYTDGKAAAALASANTYTDGQVATLVPFTRTVTAGNGLDGGGDLSGNITIDAKKDVGWTTSTGTPSKGAYATYAGQTVSVVYVQAEAQQTDNAVKALSQRLKAIEDALRSNEAIN